MGKSWYAVDMPEEGARHRVRLAVDRLVERDFVDVRMGIIRSRPRHAAREIHPLAQPVGESELLVIRRMELWEEEQAAILQRVADRLDDVRVGQARPVEIHAQMDDATPTSGLTGGMVTVIAKSFSSPVWATLRVAAHRVQKKTKRVYNIYRAVGTTDWMIEESRS